MRRSTKLLWLTGLLCGSLFAMGAGAAQAQTGSNEIAVIFVSATPLGGGDFEYTWNVELAGAEVITPGDPIDFFTTYDIFCGLVGQAEAEARVTRTGLLLTDFSVVAEATSTFPAPLVPGTDDDPLRTNLRFVHNNTSTIGNDFASPVATPLGTLSVLVSGANGLTAFDAQTSLTLTDSTTGPTTLQAVTSRAYEAPVCAVIPEPGAMALLLPGLLPLGVMLRRRRSS